MVSKTKSSKDIEPATPKTSKWETAAHIAAVLALLLGGYNLYLINIQGPLFQIQNFPEKEITVGVNKSVSFTFFIYNPGGKTGFVRDSNVYIVTKSEKKTVFPDFVIEPQKEYFIEPKDTKQISINLPPPGSKQVYEIEFEINFGEDNKRENSDPLIVKWV